MKTADFRDIWVVFADLQGLSLPRPSRSGSSKLGPYREESQWMVHFVIKIGIKCAIKIKNPEPRIGIGIGVEMKRLGLRLRLRLGTPNPEPRTPNSESRTPNRYRHRYRYRSRDEEIRIKITITIRNPEPQTPNLPAQGRKPLTEPRIFAITIHLTRMPDGTGWGSVRNRTTPRRALHRTCRQFETDG